MVEKVLTYIMYFLYVLRSEKDNSLYKGISNDPSRREKEHNQGKNLSTKSKIPWELDYVEVCKDRKEAREKEVYYKTGSGRETLKELLKLINIPR